MCVSSEQQMDGVNFNEKSTKTKFADDDHLLIKKVKIR